MITQLQALTHKEGVDKSDWLKVKNNLILLALAVAFYCSKRNLRPVFTSIIREGIKGVSVSKTHIEGRAFDISVIGWKEKDIEDLLEWFKETFKVGAISSTTGEERAVIYERRELNPDGSIRKEAHLHFQVGINKEGFKS